MAKLSKYIKISSCRKVPLTVSFKSSGLFWLRIGTLALESLGTAEASLEILGLSNTPNKLLPKIGSATRIAFFVLESDGKNMVLLQVVAIR